MLTQDDLTNHGFKYGFKSTAITKSPGNRTPLKLDNLLLPTKPKNY